MTIYLLNHSVYPIFNGLSDHDAQLLIIKNIGMHLHKQKIITRRNINNHTLLNFKMNLSYETWDETFNSDDVDTGHN